MTEPTKTNTDKLPMDNHQDRAEAAQQPDTSSQASFNQREAHSGNDVPDRGRSGHDQEQPGRMKNETAVRQQSELREERDKGYGSQHLGNEFQDVKIEDKENDEEAA